MTARVEEIRALLAPLAYRAPETLSTGDLALRDLLDEVDRIKVRALKRREWERGANGYGRCVMCKADMDADETDVGVGTMQTGPAFCPDCHAYQNDDGTWNPGASWAPRGDVDELEAERDSANEAKHTVAVQAKMAVDRARERADAAEARAHRMEVSLKQLADAFPDMASDLGAVIDGTEEDHPHDEPLTDPDLDSSCGP